MSWVPFSVLLNVILIFAYIHLLLIKPFEPSQQKYVLWVILATGVIFSISQLIINLYDQTTFTFELSTLAGVLLSGMIFFQIYQQRKEAQEQKKVNERRLNQEKFSKAVEKFSSESEELWLGGLVELSYFLQFELEGSNHFYRVTFNLLVAIINSYGGDLENKLHFKKAHRALSILGTRNTFLDKYLEPPFLVGGLKIDGSYFKGRNFENIKFINCNFSNTTFEDCKFRNFTECYFGSVSFRNCSFENFYLCTLDIVNINIDPKKETFSACILNLKKREDFQSLSFLKNNLFPMGTLGTNDRKDFLKAFTNTFIELRKSERLSPDSMTFNLEIRELLNKWDSLINQDDFSEYISVV